VVDGLRSAQRRRDGVEGVEGVEGVAADELIELTPAITVSTKQSTTVTIDLWSEAISPDSGEARRVGSS
jgi:hypothetical protein